MVRQTYYPHRSQEKMNPWGMLAFPHARWIINHDGTLASHSESLTRTKQ